MSLTLCEYLGKRVHSINMKWFVWIPSHAEMTLTIVLRGKKTGNQNGFLDWENLDES